jgi:hypothetical protein
VIEINQDIIDLVEPLLVDRWGHDRVRVVRADALTAPLSDDRWSVVWHDIWPNICSSNLPEMKRLTEAYSRSCEWQGCWNEEICADMLEKERLAMRVALGMEVFDRMLTALGVKEGATK